jgi:hypothetical protein
METYEVQLHLQSTATPIRYNYTKDVLLHLRGTGYILYTSTHSWSYLQIRPQTIRKYDVSTNTSAELLNLYSMIRIQSCIKCKVGSGSESKRSGSATQVIAHLVAVLRIRIRIINFFKLIFFSSASGSDPGCSVSGPETFGSAFKLSPDPYSEPGSWIQMSKNRLKKPKFTVTDFKDENRKMLRLSWNFNHSFLLISQELNTLGNFLFLVLLKSYHIEWKFVADCIII